MGGAGWVASGHWRLCCHSPLTMVGKRPSARYQIGRRALDFETGLRDLDGLRYCAILLVSKRNIKRLCCHNPLLIFSQGERGRISVCDLLLAHGKKSQMALALYCWTLKVLHWKIFFIDTRIRNVCLLQHAFDPLVQSSSLYKLQNIF